MKEINYWKQFESTGSVEDYLNYRSNRKDPETRSGSASYRESASFTGLFRENAGDGGGKGAGHAGTGGSDGDRDKGGADGRI